MSADNSIYIRPGKDAKFRVKTISSLYPENLSEEQIDNEFEDVSEKMIADSLEAAVEIAEKEWNRIEKEGGYVEYGIETLERK